MIVEDGYDNLFHNVHFSEISTKMYTIKFELYFWPNNFRTINVLHNDKTQILAIFKKRKRTI